MGTQRVKKKQLCRICVKCVNCFRLHFVVVVVALFFFFVFLIMLCPYGVHQLSDEQPDGILRNDCLLCLLSAQLK